ncbi:Kelch repeat-containing protein [Flagellimonas sp.]|uniref:Kelch repeat-containing protein n=1 Tax=Flagellimonas sp. TaxID=2058762 RepID=UPI003BB0C0A4
MKKCYFLFICTVTVLFLNCKKDDGSLPVDDTPEDVIENPETDILDFSPGLGARGTQVTIRGENFDPEPEGNEVQFNGMLAQVESASDTTLVVIVPEDATTGKISLSANGYDYTSFQDFTVLLPPPIISDFEPKTGVEGDEVTITGDHFGEGNYIVKVYFEGSNIPAEILSITDTQIIVKVPDANSGELRVVVQPQEGISDSEFTYLPWRQMKDFEHESRRFAAVGTVGDDVFMGLGLGSSGNNLSDFWKYQSQTDTWTQLPNFPGNPRFGTFHFVLNGHIYVGGGTDNSSEAGPNDFYRYDPATNTWTQLSDFPANPDKERQFSSSFAIDGKGYVYGGVDHGVEPFYDDLWVYDPETDTWSEKAGFEIAGRAGAVGFSINGKGYIATGFRDQPPLLSDVWEYNPINDSWTQKTSLPQGMERYSSFGFSLKGKGYLGMGIDEEDNLLKDIWEFDPMENGGAGSWIKKSDFPAEERYFPMAVATDEKAIIGLGLGLLYLSDIWEYTPRHDE